MKRPTHDQLQLLCVYAKATRDETIRELCFYRSYYAETDPWFDSTAWLLETLRNMTDEEFDSLDRVSDCDTDMEVE